MSILVNGFLPRVLAVAVPGQPRFDITTTDGLRAWIACCATSIGIVADQFEISAADAEEIRRLQCH